MSQLVCSSCLLNFPEEPAYKEHYKTDFHRYNIARKMINLAPVSFEAYKEKFDKISEQKIITPIQSQTFKCCNKEFKSSKTYQAHLVSKSHQQNQLKSPITTNRSQTGDSLLNSNVCLFCDELCDTLEDCLKHMSNHGFFIREQKCCINIEGLLKALSEQINKNNTCLHCFQTFKNSHATKDHMLDKGHCFMPQQEYKVLSKYYNFEEKLLGILAEQKEQQLQIEAKKQQLQLKQEQKEDQQDKKVENQVEEEGDWEDDEDLDLDSDEEEEDLKLKQKQTDDLQTDEQLRQKRLKQLLKQISKHKATLTKTGELLLPDGKLLGHRDYRKYYKQNHIPFKVAEPEKVEQLDVADENQLALLSNDLIVGHLRHFYYQKTRTLAHGQTKIGQRNNLIQMRWLRKSC
ncbi:unnamed protein product (macronuclear) [Paramecium tetraurelia]|uniref:C2H2-type domain-containing protein n=1 Tax=Paramecium tetraurelia TaxID=5888 RepID=A0CL87_PARTE|nr:uncharacterized protein GSPATT00008101001 [Paramecium tetraurelia]CAK71554.1 unnamed protein product [Paramecium tetraurelia]|eukprot:XP_001438951.1 hypothetical protein (macronuclear) [Paramecium tetraurelia strain d4-2]